MRYCGQIGKVAAIVEFDKVGSVTTGHIEFHIEDEHLRKMAGGDLTQTKIPWEYTAAKGLNIYFPDKWQDQTWTVPVIKAVADVVCDGLREHNIAVKQTYA